MSADIEYVFAATVQVRASNEDTALHLLRQYFGESEDCRYRVADQVDVMVEAEPPIGALEPNDVE